MIMKIPPHHETPAGAASDPLAQIEGISFADGLYYAAGNRELYKAILKAFAANHGDSIRRAQSALSTGDNETARRTVHSLKGAAGTIGAAELQKTAQAAEHAIADQQEQAIVRAMAGLERLISPMLPRIQAVLAAEADA